jgi:hypothetical protein
VGSIDPNTQKEPAGHSWHACDDDERLTEEKKPALQGVQEFESLSMENVPCGQGWHEVEKSADEKYK